MKIISRRTTAKRIDISISSLKRIERDDPYFPRKVRLSPGRIGFIEDEVDDWIRRLGDVRDQAHEPGDAQSGDRAGAESG